MQIWNDEDQLIFERKLRFRVKTWSLSLCANGTYEFCYVLNKAEADPNGYCFQMIQFDDYKDERYNNKQSFAIQDFDNVLINAENRMRALSKEERKRN